MDETAVKQFIAQGMRHPQFMSGSLRSHMIDYYKLLVFQSDGFTLKKMRDERVYGLSLLDVTVDEMRRIIHDEIHWLLPGMVTRIPDYIKGHRNLNNGAGIVAGLTALYDEDGDTDTTAAFHVAEPSAEVMGWSVDANWLLVRKRDPLGVLSEADERSTGARLPVMFKDRPHEQHEMWLDEDVVRAPALLPAEYHLLLDIRSGIFKRRHSRVLLASRSEVAEGLVNRGLIMIKDEQPRTRATPLPSGARSVRATDLGLRFMGFSGADRLREIQGYL